MTDIVLVAHICAERRNYSVTFPDQDMAMAWAEERRSTHVVSEHPDHPVGEENGRLLEYLHPTCEHGLSESLCAGPGHYPSDM